MIDSLSEHLDARLGRLKNEEKPRYLHGVYKQVVPSRRNYHRTQGEYRRELWQLDSHKKMRFITNLASNLMEYGMTNHAKRLLRHHQFDMTLKCLDHTLGEMELAGLKTGISAKLHGAKLNIYPDGVQLDINGYGKDHPYSTSIILRGGSYGSPNLFEAYPTFGGKSLKEAGMSADECPGGLTLGQALDLAGAVASKNRAKVSKIIESL